MRNTTLETTAAAGERRPEGPIAVRRLRASFDAARRGLALVLVAAALLGCAAPPSRPDLARLYRVGAATADTTPLIVIPGIFGSKLRQRTNGVEVWPGRWNDVLWSDYAGLA